MAMIGGISGIVTLLSIAVFGGEIKRQVAVNTSRLTAIESFGSPALLAHDKMDDQRVFDLNRRVTTMEETIRQISDIRVDLRGINTKLDMLTDEIKAVQARQK